MTRRRTRVLSADGSVVWSDCIVASTPVSRMRGLLGRRELAKGEALLLRPCSSIHTCFMRFAIDVVFLDRDGCVVKVVDHLVPWRVSWCKGAREAIEVAAGAAARAGIATGQQVRFAAGAGSHPSVTSDLVGDGVA
jgi:uncharacterized membrane protein (UPF0127 family)